MSEQELIFKVKELHILSLACANCGHGTTFDFETKDYLEKLVSPRCAVCNTELEVDLREQLNAYRGFYDSMSKCERVEFRARLSTPPAAASASQVKDAVSSAVADVQDAVTAAFDKEYASGR
ncbi:MAG TPA: hypothetical protein VGG04_04385 [Candidatus Sulfotelmatobacter sp.]|jgi:hypothetical protein